MIFAAMLGAVWFGDRLTPLSICAAIVIVVAVALYQRYGQKAYVDRERVELAHKLQT